MKAETSVTIGGEVCLEVIGETDFEVEMLRRAWKLNGYRSGNGKTKAPNGGSTGFYVPLFSTILTSD